MYSAIATNLLYPIGEAVLGTKMLKYRNELKETQWWSLARLQELQNEKLRDLIKHSYKNVLYYRRIFGERGLTDKDIQTAEDLQKLPILTKNDIRENFSDLIASDSNKRRPFLDATGGSTGEPLKFYIDMRVTSINWAGTFRGWEWAGYKLGDKRATLAGSSLVPDKRLTFMEYARQSAERDLRLSAFDMNQQKMGLYVEKLKKFKPKFLRGYPSALYVFANYLREKGINDIRPKAVFTTAEMLLPKYREIIENRFECKVFDNYGCYDGGLQAMECSEHCGFHISAEKAVMEFVGEDTKPVSLGCPGDILATDLDNYTMPFIRYAVGDIGTLSEERCPCGRGLPLMKSLQGRVGDFVTTPDGKKVHGEFFSHILWETSTVIQFQVVQEEQDNIRIKLVPHPKATPTELNTEKQRISDIVSTRVGNMNINIEFVGKIPTTKSGKRKFIISKIAR